MLPLALLLLWGGCRKSDAERAAEERAKVEKRIRDSTLLVPYRSLKLIMRAGDSEQTPEEVRRAWASTLETAERVLELPETPATPMERARTARMFLDLGIDLYRAQRVLDTHDEDDLPLLADRFALKPSPRAFLPGYDSGMEHLFLGITWGMTQLALRDRMGSTDLPLYEFSRANPRSEWPGLLRVLVRAGRGATFLEAGYHYASEEELNAYLDEVKALGPMSLELIASQGEFSPEQHRQQLLASGHALRAWNRLKLEREGPAVEDMERALEALEKGGVENELTWWGTAFVHTRHERYAQAAVSLDKLAASPFLDEPTRQELRSNAEQLRAHGGGVPLLRQERAALLLARALVARAGGVERVLASVLGEARARELAPSFVAVDRMLQGMAGTKTEDLARESEGLLNRARQAGRDGLSRLKQELGAAGREATAGSSPP